jgi:hypothetical protein
MSGSSSFYKILIGTQQLNYINTITIMKNYLAKNDGLLKASFLAHQFAFQPPDHSSQAIV